MLGGVNKDDKELEREDTQTEEINIKKVGM